MNKLRHAHTAKKTTTTTTKLALDEWGFRRVHKSTWSRQWVTVVHDNIFVCPEYGNSMNK